MSEILSITILPDTNSSAPRPLKTVQVHREAEENEASSLPLQRLSGTQDEGVKGPLCFCQGSDVHILDYGVCHLNPPPDKKKHQYPAENFGVLLISPILTKTHTVARTHARSDTHARTQSHIPSLLRWHILSNNATVVVQWYFLPILS